MNAADARRRRHHERGGRYDLRRLYREKLARCKRSEYVAGTSTILQALLEQGIDVAHSPGVRRHSKIEFVLRAALRQIVDIFT